MDHYYSTLDSTLTLNLLGKFTTDDAKIFAHLIESISDKKYNKVVIDFTKLESIDPAGLGDLLSVRDKCQHSAIMLTLKSPHDQVKKMFDISRFDDLFSIEYQN